MHILESLQFVPMKPRDWFKQFHRLCKENNLTEEEVLRRIGKTKEWFDDMSDPTKQRDFYAQGLARAVKYNTRFTIEEIASILGHDLQWLKDEVEHAKTLQCD